MARTPLIDANDILGMLPAGTGLERAAQLAADIDTLLAGDLPCLAELDAEKLARAKAIIRLSLSSVLDRQGVTSVARTRGPFTERLTLSERPDLRAALSDDVVPRLAALCSPVTAYASGMHSVPLKLPGVYS